MNVEFFVPGIPAPKGSFKAFMNRGMRFPVIVADNRPTQKAWQSTVTIAAAEKIKTPIAGGVTVLLKFILPRPKSLPKKVQLHLKKPDVDKLGRTVLDGLKGIAYPDDSEVIWMASGKRYVEFGEATGCQIKISAANAQQELPCLV